MNFESTKWRREAIDDIVVDEETLPVAGAAAIIIAVAAFWSWSSGHDVMSGGGEKAVAPKGKQGEQLPAVTVVVPGRQDVAALISATGSLAARRDMRSACPARRQGRPRPRRARSGSARPDARGPRPPRPDAGAAQLAPRSRSTGPTCASPKRARPRPAAGLARLVSQADIDRKRARATRRARGCASPRRAGASAPARRLDVRARPRPSSFRAASRPARWSAPARAPVPLAAGGEMELRARLPQPDLAGFTSASR